MIVPMFELIKKTLLAGLGATVTTKEQLEKKLHELVEKGKLSKEEAEKMAEDIVKESKDEFAKSKKEMNKVFDEWMDKTGLVQQTEFAKLEARVASLEKQLSEEKEGAKKSAAKKTAS